MNILDILENSEPITFVFCKDDSGTVHFNVFLNGSEDDLRIKFLLFKGEAKSCPLVVGETKGSLVVEL